MSQEITQDILTQAVEEVIEECGRPNLAALERELPLTREQLKRLKKNNFVLKLLDLHSGLFATQLCLFYNAICT